MARYIGKRVLTMIPVLIGVSLLIFLLLELAPGDAAQSILGDYASEESLNELREEMGLNDPLIVQYGRFMKDLLLKGDLGNSYQTGRPVLETILERYPMTILVAILAVIATALLGVTTGLLSAMKQYSWIDNICTVIGMIGVSSPSFFTGLILIFIFSGKLGWLPASGSYGPQYFILPIITMAFGSCASQMRMTRSAMLEVMRQDYIRTAKAKGQGDKKIVFHHELRNALVPIITVIGQQAGVLLGGAMIVEQIFSIPGVGKLMIDSIGTRDYPMVRGGVLFIALSFSVVNLLVDLAYSTVDPRIRSQLVHQSKKKKGASA